MEANLARFVACFFVARKTNDAFSRNLSSKLKSIPGIHYVCACINSPSPSPSGPGSSTREYVRSRPEEEDHPVASHSLAQSNPESIPCTIRNLHQRVRKAHFCPVDCAVARRLEQRQDVMVCRVYYDALQKRLLQKSEPAVLIFCFLHFLSSQSEGENPQGE